MVLKFFLTALFNWLQVGQESEEPTTVASQMPPPPKLMRSGRKVLMNPHYRGAINAQPECK